MGLDITSIGHSELEKLVSLAASHQRNRRSRENFFVGKIPRSDLGAGMPQELDLFHSELNYARITVDALLDRMQLEELRCGTKQAQLAAKAIWERSGMREQAHLGFQEAFEHGLSVGVVGPDPSGRATITLHTSVGWHVEMHPVTREVLWAFQTWTSQDGRVREATIYTPGWNYDYEKNYGSWSGGEPRATGMTRTAVVPIINRAKLADTAGTSELDTVKKFMVMAARLITNLGVAAESLALPMRLIFNVSEDQSPSSREEMMDLYLSRIMVFSDDGKATQLPGADLRNFLESIANVSRWAASSASLPLDYVGITSDNPSSAEAMARADARLVKKVQRKMAMFGQAIAELMSLALELDGVSAATAVEPVWRSAEIINLASVVDAVGKLRTTRADGKPDISRRYAQEMLGLSPERISQMHTEIEDEYTPVAA